VFFKKAKRTNQAAANIEGCKLLEIRRSELGRLNEQDFIVDGMKPAFIIGFAAPNLDLNSVVSTLKGKISTPMMFTLTAGELCNLNGQLYKGAEDARETIILHLFSPLLIDDISMHTIELPCEDIMRGNPTLLPGERVAKIVQQLEKVKPSFGLDDDNCVALTLVNGLTNCENWLMEAVYQTGNFPVPFIGGTTAGKLDFKRASYHDGTKLCDRHATICFLKLKPDYQFHTFKSQNFEPAGAKWTIGAANSATRTVTSFINNDSLAVENCIDALCKHFRCSPSSLQSALAGYSFAIKVENEFYIRSVAGIDSDAKTMAFYCDTPLGTELHLMRSTNFVQQTEKDYANFLRQQSQPLVGLFFDCILRRFIA
tara:strand:+ start:3216 stop:4325 length:1110 start_codon:yes stop_codon:yes gene_type:complete